MSPLYITAKPTLFKLNPGRVTRFRNENALEEHHII